MAPRHQTDPSPPVRRGPPPRTARTKQPRRTKPPLHIYSILARADAHYRRHGRWPTVASGKIGRAAAADSWRAIDLALQHGGRGLPPGYTLATLLAKHRGVPYPQALPPYSESEILACADAHYSRYRRWPTARSGPIPEAPGETWHKVNGALRDAYRGMPGGDTLAMLLERCGRRFSRSGNHHRQRRDPLTIDQILAWADEYFRRNGRWPASRSGPIAGARDETWASVNSALYLGMRGLPGGSSVARLLEKQCGARHLFHRPPSKTRTLLAWADAHHRRTGC